MKLPFEFGTKLIFRLVFPGLIVAIAMFPLIHGALLAAQIDSKAEYLFPVAIVACGWLVVVSDMRIYMLFEGRRYWPSILRKWMLASEKRRLETLRPLVFGGTNLSDESAVDYAQFPVNADGVSYVEYPTRLGNLIESFENYPLVKYGLDSVFYWSRFWVSLDKDLREELDNSLESGTRWGSKSRTAIGMSIMNG